jgi:hypothetical protein
MESIQNGREKNERRFRILKTLLLLLFYAASAVIAWWFMNQALYLGQPLTEWIWVGVSLLLAFSFLSLAALVVQKKSWMAAAHTAVLVGYIAIFPKDFYVMLGGALYFVLAVIFSYRIKAEEKNQLNFSFRRIVGRTIMTATSGLLLLVAANIYYNTAQEFREEPAKFSRPVAEAAARSIPFFAEDLGGADLDRSLDEYLLQRAEQELEEDVPRDQRFEFLEQYREQFISQFGISAQGQETMHTIISRIVEEQVSDFFVRYQTVFPVIFTLVILALLRMFAFVFNWLVLLLGWIMFRLLLALNFLKITKASVEVDRLNV